MREIHCTRNTDNTAGVTAMSCRFTWLALKSSSMAWKESKVYVWVCMWVNERVDTSKDEE